MSALCRQSLIKPGPTQCSRRCQSVKCVTHVPEQLLPMSPVCTLPKERGQFLRHRPGLRKGLLRERKQTRIRVIYQVHLDAVLGLSAREANPCDSGGRRGNSSAVGRAASPQYSPADASHDYSRQSSAYSLLHDRSPTPDMACRCGAALSSPRSGRSRTRSR